MFIQTEETPNPATLKFLPGREVMPQGTRDFRDGASAALSPLATSLFAIGGVTGVFLGRDFITVSKAEANEWPTLKAAVLGAIMDHFVAGRPVVLEGEAQPSVAVVDSEIVAQIKELLDIKIRPAVAQDGGDVVFHKFEDGIVWLYMQGACAGCPSSSATLKHGIENMLKHYIPEVVEVRQSSADRAHCGH